MRKLMVSAAVILLAPMTWARVWVTVYRCDEATPLDLIDSNQPTVYRDIMVGTRLVFVVSSDTSGPWDGALLLSADDGEYATLSGRGYMPVRPGTSVTTDNYLDSCLEAAGTGARVLDFNDSGGIGLQLRTGGTPYITGGRRTMPGDWFVVDYWAEQVGDCEVALYGSASLDIPLEMLLFRHVPSRDLNGDDIVDFADFALLTSCWGASADQDPNSRADAFDLNGDARIDLVDVALLSEYWLERTDCRKSPVDPSEPLTERP